MTAAYHKRKMKRFLLFILCLCLWQWTCHAYEIKRVKVGETFTVNAGYYSNLQGVSWSWDSGYLQSVSVSNHSTSATFKATRATTFAGCDMQANVYYYKNGTTSSDVNRDVVSWKVIVEDNESNDVLVSSIVLNKTSDELEVGETARLTASVYPSNATNKTVGWLTNNYAVASVVDGVVTTKAPGTAIITCIANDSGKAQAQCIIKVKEKEVQVTRIELNKTSDELEVGKTTQLTATVYPSNAANKDVKWESSNSTVATVSTSGLVTAKGVGTATITCTAKDSGNAKATCTIKVKEKESFIKYNGIRYKVLDNNNLSVQPLENDERYKGNISIPSSITSEGNSYKVVEIDDEVFKFCTDLTSVTIPNSVTRIRARAFYYCRSSIPVIIPNSVTTIEVATFYYSHITSVTIPNSVTTIGTTAFAESKITSITIPNSVTKIGNTAFVHSDLKSISIPSSITEIGYEPFSECKNLTEINVHSNNKNYCAVDGILFNKTKDKLIQYPAGKTLSLYSIPSTVSEISRGAFWGCTNLKSIVIPNSVEIIRNDAFRNCNSISKFVIPNSVNCIESLAFYGCKGLNTIMIDNLTPPAAPMYLFANSGATGEYSEEAYYENIKLLVPSDAIETYKSHEVWGRFKTIESISGQDSPDEFSYQGVNYVVLDREAGTCQTKPGTYSDGGSSVSGYLVIPATVSNGKDTFKVVSIGFSSFLGNNELTSIELPNTVRIIGNNAFEFCENLSEVKLSDGLTTIGEEAFYFTNISSIELPSTLIEIKWGAFAFSKLSDVFIPKSVSLIEPGAFLCVTFDNDKGIIKSIIVDSGNMNYTSNDGVLFDKAISSLLCFPAGKIQEKYIVPTTVRTIEDRSFQASQISSVVLPNTATKIGEFSFTGSKIKSINIPKDIREIGSYAFYDCKNLSEIYYHTDRPISIYDDIFDTECYTNATLYVPAESINKFKQTAPWKYFSKIQAYEFSSVETVIADSEPPVYFDLQGLRVETPVKGRLYIRLQNGKAEKVFIE